MQCINEFWLVTGLQIYKANLCLESPDVGHTKGILLKTLQILYFTSLLNCFVAVSECILIFGVLNTKHKAKFKAKDTV